MLDTYFYVQISLDNHKLIEFGPYISFGEAADIMMEHCDILLSTYFDDIPKKYDRCIVECTIRNFKREVLVTKVQEEISRSRL